MMIKSSAPLLRMYYVIDISSGSTGCCCLLIADGCEEGKF